MVATTTKLAFVTIRSSTNSSEFSFGLSVSCSPEFHRSGFSEAERVKCTPTLGQRELEVSGVMAQVGGGADEPSISSSVKSAGGEFFRYQGIPERLCI